MAETKSTDKPMEIRICKCKHQDQDKMYGWQNRLHNPTAKGLKCTVCGDIKTK